MYSESWAIVNPNPYKSKLCYMLNGVIINK